jgi:hypothetical protein
MNIMNIWVGILAGVIFALTGWAKAQGEAFDWDEFFTTITIGIISGTVTAFTDLSLDNTYTLLINMGLVPVFQNLFKAIYRKIFIPVVPKTV